MSKYMNYLIISYTFKFCNMKKSLLRFNILLICLVFSCNLLEKDKSKEETSNVENKSDFSIASSLIGLNKNKENKTRKEQNIQQKEKTQMPNKVHKSSEDTKDKSQDNQPTKSTDKEQQDNLLQEPSNISDLQDPAIKAPKILKPLQTPLPSLIIPTPISNPIVSMSTMTTNPMESKPSQEIASSFKTNESNIQEIKLKAVTTLLSTLSESEKNNLNLEESYDEDVCFIIKKDTNNDVFIGISRNNTECNSNYDDSDTVPLLKIEKSEIDKFKQAMLNGIDFNAKRYFNASQGKFENHNENITVRCQDAYDSYNAEEKTIYIFLDFSDKNTDYAFNDYSFAIKKSEFDKIKNWFEKL